VASSDVHLIKPDVALYKYLCTKYKLQAEQCVFADDKAVNVEGALAAGMQGIVFRDALQYAAALETLLRRNA